MSSIHFLRIIFPINQISDVADVHKDQGVASQKIFQIITFVKKIETMFSMHGYVKCFIVLSVCIRTGQY